MSGVRITARPFTYAEFLAHVENGEQPLVVPGRHAVWAVLPRYVISCTAPAGDIGHAAYAQGAIAEMRRLAKAGGFSLT